MNSNPQAIKENLVQRCAQMLSCYRQHCATPSTSGQLILPECMKLLPLYANSLVKSDVISGGEAAFCLFRVSVVPVNLQLLFLVFCESYNPVQDLFCRHSSLNFPIERTRFRHANGKLKILSMRVIIRHDVLIKRDCYKFMLVNFLLSLF